MTDEELKVKNLAQDYKMILKEARSMGCKNIKVLYNIPLENMEMIVQALEKQMPKKPKIKNRKSTMFLDYVDGHGECKVTKWQDYVCPVCGFSVGERFNISNKKSHDQRKNNFCKECGQKIDFSK